jgi:hypothetical protein
VQAWTFRVVLFAARLAAGLFILFLLIRFIKWSWNAD